MNEEARSNARTSMLLVSTLVFGICLAVAMPDDAVSRSVLARAFSDGMSTLIPSINYFSKISEVPEVTKVFLSVMWLSVPINAYLFLRIPGSIRFDQEIVNRKWWALLALAVLAYLLIVRPIIWYPMSSHELTGNAFTPTVLKLVSHSRVWLGVIGSSVCFCTAVVLAALISCLRNFRRLYLPKIVTFYKGK